MKKQFDLKEKLELLGEPALPDRLAAEELFRRMDSGELTLPEASAQSGTPAIGRVIPWVNLARRGLPIAACLAVAVLLSQTRLWDKGLSGGANFSKNAAAPQSAPAAAADQAAALNGDEEAPSESYSLGADEDAPGPAPEAVITMDDAEAEEAMEDAADQELFRKEAVQNSPQNSTVTDDSADPDDRYPSGGGSGNAVGGPPTGGSSENPDCGFNGGSDDDEPMHPDTGGPGGNEHPDTGGPPTDGLDDDDKNQSNPDTGGGGEDDKGNTLPGLLWEPLERLIDDLFEQEKNDRLSGLTPGGKAFSWWPSEGKGGPIDLQAVVSCLDDEGNVVCLVSLQATAIWSDEEGSYVLRLDGWEIEPAPSLDGAGDAFENPDTSGSPPWDPDNDPTYGENPDIGAETDPNGDESLDSGPDEIPDTEEDLDPDGTPDTEEDLDPAGTPDTEEGLDPGEAPDAETADREAPPVMSLPSEEEEVE